MKIQASLPIAGVLSNYNWATFGADITAGLITAFIAVPQTMAYAQLAGLPAEYGLYSCLLPLFFYACFGSSRCLVVGPAALIALLIASTIEKLSPASPEEYITLSVNLALLSGLFLVALNFLKLGRLANLISKPVITGFTSASAVIIAVSQINVLLGFDIPNGLSFFDMLIALWNGLSKTDNIVLLTSAVAIVFLWACKSLLPKLTKAIRLSPSVAIALNKSGPLIVVIVGIIVAATLELNHLYGLEVIGHIPGSLPVIGLSQIDIELWRRLAAPAFSIAIICFLTSISTASSLASKQKERINPNQELLALGMANIGAALTSTFALAGSVSRSMINYSSGAMTQIANVISALLIVVTILFLTPLLFHLPIAVLGTIVVFSVIPMIELKQIRQCWLFNKGDGISLLVTFATALILGVELAVWAGIASTFVLFIHRSSQPHIAEVGRAPNGYFRNVKRLDVETLEYVLFLRIDESLYFANIHHIEANILRRCEKRQQLTEVVLVFSSVNSVDESALEVIENLVSQLKARNITVHFSNVKGIISDKLKLTSFFEFISPGRLFLTADEAMDYFKTSQINK